MLDQAASNGEFAYRCIRRDILSCGLAPGEKLKVLALRDRYGIGPTPLREALSRLSSEGLIVLIQQRGFRVAPLTARELHEISDLRILLEAQAIRQSIDHGDVHWEGAIVSAFHKLERLEIDAANGNPPDPDLWERQNCEFHDALVAAADSDWLLRVRQNLYDLHGRYRAMARLHYAGGNRAVHVEHRQLMEATLQRDGDAAAALIRAHIEGTVRAVSSRLDLGPAGRLRAARA